MGVSEKDINNAFNTNKGQASAPASYGDVPSDRDRAQAGAGGEGGGESEGGFHPRRVEEERLDAEQFAQVAKRESMDQRTKEQGGDLGWNRRGNMVPEFDRWMFALAPGQLSPVIEIFDGYNIIRVDRRKPAEVNASRILIRWKIDTAQVVSGSQAGRQRARAWRGGANFDTLVVALPRSQRGEGKPAAVPAGFPAGVVRQAFRARSRGLRRRRSRSWIGARGNPKFVIAQILTSDNGGEFTVSDCATRFESNSRTSGQSHGCSMHSGKRRTSRSGSRPRVEPWARAPRPTRRHDRRSSRHRARDRAGGKRGRCGA